MFQIREGPRDNFMLQMRITTYVIVEKLRIGLKNTPFPEQTAASTQNTVEFQWLETLMARLPRLF